MNRYLHLPRAVLRSIYQGNNELTHWNNTPGVHDFDSVALCFRKAIGDAANQGIKFPVPLIFFSFGVCRDRVLT